MRAPALTLSLMLIFHIFAALAVWLGIASLRGGARYLAYVRREMSRERARWTPRLSLFAPLRGVDQGLRENIAALFRQDYPAYEIIFVTDDASDPALAIIEEARAANSARAGVSSRILVAGYAAESGQKVHNLSVAVGEAAAASEVFVFVDSDARPPGGWLGALVAPLADERIGAATGYRWFIPERGGLASHLRAVWNASIASALGANSRKNFCWGGATAIRRATFERLNILEEWRGTLSDDYALTRALQRAGLPIRFVPACLTPSFEDCGFRELWEFTTRQVKITRVYAPHLWQALLISGFIFVPVFFGGIALTIARAALGLSYIAPLLIVCALYGLGTTKAYLRLRAVALPLAPYKRQLQRGATAQLLLWPVATALFWCNSLAAWFSRRIEWRGITYELKSPAETVIIHDANQPQRHRDAEKTKKK